MENNLYIYTKNGSEADLNELPLPKEDYVMRVACLAGKAEEPKEKDYFVVCVDLGFADLDSLITAITVALGNKLIICNRDGVVLGVTELEQGYVIIQTFDPQIFAKLDDDFVEIEQNPTTWKNLQDPEVATSYGFNI